MIPVYERHKLSEQFIEFIKKEGVPNELLPYWDDNWGYRCDWNIVGGENSRLLFEPYYDWYTTGHYNNIFNIKTQKQIQSIVSYLSRKIFEPNLMIRNAILTDRVKLRIAVTMLNKVKIPKDISDTFFDNMICTYWIRKRAYDMYFCKEVMQFPFAPDYIL